MIQKKNSFLIVAGILMVFLLFSCDVFETRKPEDPVQNYSWNSYPFTPYQALDNFMAVFNSLQYVPKYRSMFSESFNFFFEPLDVAEYGVPTAWSIDKENESYVNFTNYIISDNMELLLNEIASEPDNNFEDYLKEFYISREYLLNVNHSIDSLSVMKGKIILKMEVIDSIWKITEWYDFRLDSSNTWGRLKNEYAL
ncbi:MAG: hypothetical protein PHR06_10940 [Candidatus Cloacimonetes bacterium]|nr:hypothetical protein [Candidatus Cloacimonadota bacterium]